MSITDIRSLSERNFLYHCITLSYWTNIPYQSRIRKHTKHLHYVENKVVIFFLKKIHSFKFVSLDEVEYFFKMNSRQNYSELNNLKRRASGMILNYLWIFFRMKKLKTMTKHPHFWQWVLVLGPGFVNSWRICLS
jgi:glycosyltransferase involved in cell wall biosynthesis